MELRPAGRLAYQTPVPLATMWHSSLDAQGGSLHAAIILQRPSQVIVGAFGVVSPSYARNLLHDAIVSDAVASPPELVGDFAGVDARGSHHL